MTPDRDIPRSFYRRLLGLSPRSFRDRYADDLLQAFDDRCSEHRFAGTWGGLRLVPFLFRDFVTSVPLAQQPIDRNRGVERIMGDFLRDLQFSARMLIKNPMFTVAAVTTLALGIGLNAATFSAVHGLLLRPLPGAEAPEELVQLYREYPGIEFGSNSIPHFQDIRDRSSEVFENVGAYYFTPVSLSADGRSERIIGMAVSANFFQTYGVEPMLGRAFIPGEEDRDPGAHAVAILGHAFWQTRFGEDPGVVGSTLRLNGHAFEIVGIAPPDFAGPVTFAAVPVYVPLMMQREIEPGRDRIGSRGNNNMNAIGRLRDGQTLERAQQVFESILLQLREEYPDHYARQTGTRMVPQNEAGIHPTFASAQVGMSAVIMAVVGLLLLIACVNVANLFLARARDRRREMGIRLSLGEDPKEFMYLSYHARFRSDMVVVARTPTDPQAVLRQMQNIIRSADPDMPVYDVRSMEDHMGIALLPARLGGSVLGLFGLLGLALAAVGIYGVMAYSVSQRRREIGIRVALGADRKSVLTLVLSEGMRLAIAGTMIGLVGALGASQLIKGLLYNVQAIDPVAFIGVPLLLVGVAATAVYLPARKAAAAEPMRALKSD